MRNIGAYVMIGAFAAVVFLPSPSAAFGLRLGPLYFGLPFARHGHHRHAAVHSPVGKERLIYDKAAYEKPNAGGTAAAQEGEPAVLYPKVALPGLYDEIFRPERSASWPLGYADIFRTAFAKLPPDADTQACQPGDRGAGIVARIRSEIRPDAAQMPVLQKLAEALGAASGYLTRACAEAVPPQPVARLQLMQGQIQALTMALDLVRPPLQQFEQSLSASQLTRFAALRSSAPAAGCGAASAVTDWSIAQISQRLQPTADERSALGDLKQAFASAAADLDAHCPRSPAATPLARLEAIESRLDASWRTALAMQVALAGFESRLSAQQRARLDAMEVTVAQ